MTSQQPKDRGSRDADAHPKEADAHPKEADVMRGRSFEGTEYAATEQEQTRERQRAGRDHTDEVGETTETELDDGDV
jgi:hypothetical protein